MGQRLVSATHAIVMPITIVAMAVVIAHIALFFRALSVTGFE